MEEIYCKITKNGFPSLSESGGGASNTGHATIIANPKGGRKKAIYIPRGGHLSNLEHAHFVVKEGDAVITVSHSRKDFNINVFKIKEISLKDKKIKLDKIESYLEETQNDYQNSIFCNAIKAAIQKSTTYHCREPFFYTAENKESH